MHAACKVWPRNPSGHRPPSSIPEVRPWLAWYDTLLEEPLLAEEAWLTRPFLDALHAARCKVYRIRAPDRTCALAQAKLLGIHRHATEHPGRRVH